MELSKDKYIKEERKQKIHRTINTILLVVVVIFGIFFIKSQMVPLYERVTGIEEQRIIQSEIDQIAEDEGYRACRYKDSLGLSTIGFGTLIENDATITCIDGHSAVNLLREHYTDATLSVEKRYPWAESKAKLVLVNLTYNLGATRLAKFNLTLKHFEAGEYDLAAGELLNSRYAKQVPNRAGRLAGRIMALGG